MLRRGGGQLLVMDGPGDAAGICALRALVQVMAARLDLDRLDLRRLGQGPAPTRRRLVSLDDLAETLELYRWGDGYADHPGTDAVSGDDNAAVVLAGLQAHAQLVPAVADSLWLHRAKRTFEVVTAGPLRAELAGHLYLATGIERYAAIAAEPVAEPAVDHGPNPFPVGHGWWRRPPADNAVSFGRILRRDGVEPQPGELAELDRYLERVWQAARDPATGQFTGGGIGRSPDRGPTLDHAAIVQLLAWQALLLGPDRPSPPTDQA